MGPINDITGIISQFNKVEKEANSKRVKPSQTTSSAKTSKLESSTQSVNVEISTSGKHLLQREQDLLRYIETLKNKTTISSNHLTSLQNKVNSGYYSRSEVVEKIADAIIDLPLFQEFKQHIVKTTEAPDASLTDRDDLAHIRENIRNHVYEEDKVIDKVVERVLNAIEPED